LALECLAGGCNGNVDIFLSRFVDGADDFFGGRVDDLEGLAVDTFDELVVDEASGLLVGFFMHGQETQDNCRYVQSSGLGVFARVRGLELD
jgi:hypothetical protein